jgi:hypothetical protein
MFRSRRYRKLLEVTAQRFPDASILAARDAFRSSAEWRAKWPAMLLKLSALTFITDPDGWMGAGCYRELQDARRRGLAIHHFDGKQLVALDDVRFDCIDPADWDRYAHLDLLSVADERR